MNKNFGVEIIEALVPGPDTRAIDFDFILKIAGGLRVVHYYFNDGFICLHCIFWTRSKKGFDDLHGHLELLL